MQKLYELLRLDVENEKISGRKCIIIYMYKL